MDELRALLAEAGPSHDGLTFTWDGDDLVARLPAGRRQRLRCERAADTWHFTTPVATRRTWESDWDAPLLATHLLERNRAVPVVAFGLDGRRRIIASVEHPAASLQPEELRLLLATLARQADRLEREMAGGDRY